MEAKLTIQELSAMKPLQVLEDERVKKRFINLFMNLHKADEDQAENFYEKEHYNMLRIIQGSEELQKCTAFSVYGCFLDVASMALSLDNVSQPLLYVLPGSVKVGDKYEKRATLEVSPYGELALRMQSGQLLYADSPVIVYEGDKFKPIVNERGQKICLYEASIPRMSKNIIGSFIRLTRADGSVDFSWMLPDDIERLKGYSAKKNRNNSGNALYSSNEGQIDTGFLAAKTIKHAFKTFPKVRIGEFSKLQNDEPQAANYGLDERITPEMTAKPEPEPFQATEPSQPVVQQASVIVEDDDEVF
jgi:recombinational DNA repair protein RecT